MRGRMQWRIQANRELPAEPPADDQNEHAAGRGAGEARLAVIRESQRVRRRAGRLSDAALVEEDLYSARTRRVTASTGAAGRVKV
jgi:hypothetical protein